MNGGNVVATGGASIWERVAGMALGVAFLVLGMLGLIFPILPGWIFIFASLIAFASAIPAMRRFVSSVIRSAPARRVIDGAAKSERGRRLIAAAMRVAPLRRGMTSTARHEVVRSLLRRASEGNGPE